MSLGSRQKWEIRTVEDFLKLEPKSRAVCLREFAQWCVLHDLIDDLNDTIKTVGAGVRSPRDVFHWIEDDKGEITFTIKTPGSTP